MDGPLGVHLAENPASSQKPDCEDWFGVELSAAVGHLILKSSANLSSLASWSGLTYFEALFVDFTSIA
ncbi:MAG: hypothetical protein QXY54_06135 [Nitrososphaerota archaeon]